MINIINKIYWKEIKNVKVFFIFLRKGKRGQ